MGDLFSLLDRQTRADPRALAILAPGRRPLSYHELREQVALCGRVMDGIAPEPTTRVAVGLPNGPEMAVACLGVAACRPCIPLNPADPMPELRQKLLDTRAELVVAEQADDGALRAAATELGLTVIDLRSDASRDAAGIFSLHSSRLAASAVASSADRQRYSLAEDIGLVFQTSGTTAKPKVVRLAHRNFVSVAENVARLYSLGGEDRCLSVMPLFHSHALIFAMMSALAGGGSIVCASRFHPEDFFRWIEEFRPTWYTAVPAIHQAVVANADNYRRFAPSHRFRFVASGSASLSPATLVALEAVVGAPVIESYGLTETATIFASNLMPPGQRKPGSVGLPVGSEVAIIDEAGAVLPNGRLGEIAAKGPGIMVGYEGNDAANLQAFVGGWFRTGDQGYLDPDGYLFITGRIKEIVNRGGMKVSPREIDDILLELPDVAQAAAFGFPHPSLGEDLAAAIVLEPGAVEDPQGLRSALAARLPAHKVPSRIVFVKEIPRTATGKIQRVSMYERLLAPRSPSSLPQRELSPTERLIAQIWGDALGMEAIAPSDTFFDLGGDSLRAKQVIALIERQTGKEVLPMKFALQTLEQIAADLDRAALPVPWPQRLWRRARSASRN